MPRRRRFPLKACGLQLHRGDVVHLASWGGGYLVVYPDEVRTEQNPGGGMDTDIGIIMLPRPITNEPNVGPDFLTMHVFTENVWPWPTGERLPEGDVDAIVAAARLRAHDEWWNHEGG